MDAFIITVESEDEGRGDAPYSWVVRGREALRKALGAELDFLPDSVRDTQVDQLVVECGDGWCEVEAEEMVEDLMDEGLVEWDDMEPPEFVRLTVRRASPGEV